MKLIRTLLFYILFIITTFLWSFAILIMRLLPEHLHHRYSIGWADTTIWLRASSPASATKSTARNTCPNNPPSS